MEFARLTSWIIGFLCFLKIGSIFAYNKLSFRNKFLRTHFLTLLCKQPLLPGFCFSTSRFCFRLVTIAPLFSAAICNVAHREEQLREQTKGFRQWKAGSSVGENDSFCRVIFLTLKTYMHRELYNSVKKILVGEKNNKAQFILFNSKHWHLSFCLKLASISPV